jgi:PAS domain S-box-containing protein
LNESDKPGLTRDPGPAADGRARLSLVGSRIALAVGTVSLAFALQLAIHDYIRDQQPFVAFYLAIMVTAWWGGLGASLAAVALGLAAGSYFTLTDSMPMALGPDELVLTAAYAVFAPLIAVFVNEMRQAQRRADRASREARESAAQARASEHRIRRLVDSSIIGVVFWAEDGRITDANYAFLRVSGRSKEDLDLGRLRWTDIVAPDCLPLHEAALAEIRLRGECEPFDSAIVRSDGERVPMLCGGVSLDASATEGVTFIVDMTEIRRVRRELEEEEARYRTLFEDSPIVLIEQDWRALKRELDLLRASHGDLTAYFDSRPQEAWRCFALIRVARVNRAGRDLLAIPRAERIPADLFRVVDEESLGRIVHMMSQVADGESQLLGEELFITTAGQRRVMMLQASILPEHQEMLDSVLVTLVDVTEEREIQADRGRLLAVAERARAEAEAASRAKDQFLAMLGHELRNPFAAVRNAVTTARLDSSRRTRALDVAERQCDQLGRLIDDLLDVARITQARINLRKERLPLAEVVHRAVEATQDVVEDRGHRLELSVLDDVHVEADPARLEQVVVNLLTNAAKYTEPGGHVFVSVWRQGIDAVVQVRDTGVGISADVLPHVFELFAQGERTLDRAQGGLGIGLTLVRRIVELHGGRVEAHSDGVGKGAEFEVRLPAVASAERAAEPATAEASRGGSARVVVIEDNPDAAETLVMLLEVLGHRVRVFHDGPSALEAAAANPPDVMLVDIGLPGIDGYEVARRVRKQPELARVRLVALTGYGLDEDKRRSMAAGFDRHLVKPVDLRTLEDLVPRLAREESGRSVH